MEVADEEMHSSAQGATQSAFKSSLNIFSRFQSHCMKGSKKKRKAKERKGQKKKNTKNGHDPLEPLQMSSGPQETTLKWDKLSPSEFETLQEYIQCK